ncbi:uncharacterized protein LOC123212802 isoform X2 [Mangifera indica]|uniref:uncharacterized protein LOC123212802 isoform X2 n=1 Tax=Mangifera indica TaxID=29780 RepID=UPI001CFA9B54|nr:uncharacterized protein LOC123212802 isoform X2 [Mangifera indica]
MATELQPPDNPTTVAVASTTAATAAPASTNSTAIQPVQTDAAGPPLAPKRQRRPSVRLGEIGDQPSYDSHVRRNKPFHHTWRLPKDASSKSIKARSLTNLVNGSVLLDFQEDEDRNQNGDGNNNTSNLEFTHRKVKSKRAPTAKRARTNWTSRIDEGAEGDSREDGDETFRDFDHDSDSPLKDQSPVHSVDNVAMDFWPGHRRGASGSDPGRTRVSDGRENGGAEFDNDPGTCDGVRSFLIELGLSRYAPVFEIHEVDDEVLPMLTLEDLKDMGINAVGSRRKMYAAIQKLPLLAETIAKPSET